ncbi:hypothetical protein KCU71_g1505, partial [Aureobasidium melanogenum]
MPFSHAHDSTRVTAFLQVDTLKGALLSVLLLPLILPEYEPDSASPTGPTSRTIWTDWSRHPQQGYGAGYCQHSLYLHIRLRSTHFPLLLHVALVETASNSLLFSSTSDSSLAVQLHPLVLLTTSDYTTCHSMHSQQGPIVGAIIDQQSAHTITMEQAFQCNTKEQGDKVLIDEEWFTERLEQFKDVQKSPRLDLVVICFLDPPSGPLTDYPTTRIIISLTKAFKPPCRQVFSSLSIHAIPVSNFDPPTTQMQEKEKRRTIVFGRLYHQ